MKKIVYKRLIKEIKALLKNPTNTYPFKLSFQNEARVIELIKEILNDPSFETNEFSYITIGDAKHYHQDVDNRYFDDNDLIDRFKPLFRRHYVMIYSWDGILTVYIIKPKTDLTKSLSSLWNDNGGYFIEPPYHLAINTNEQSSALIILNIIYRLQEIDYYKNYINLRFDIDGHIYEFNADVNTLITPLYFYNMLVELNTSSINGGAVEYKALSDDYNKYSLYKIEVKHPLSDKKLYIRIGKLYNSLDNITYDISKGEYDVLMKVYDNDNNRIYRIPLEYIRFWYNSLTDAIWLPLDCPYSEKDEVKQYDAKWDHITRKWKILNSPYHINKCKKWLPDEDIYECECGSRMYESCKQSHIMSYNHMLYEVARMIIMM